MKSNFIKNIDLIIWDWNGTLLDDVEYSVECINKVLEKYGYPKISIEKYRNIFTFPIVEFYKAIGFNFEKHSFHKVGGEFIELYNKALQSIDLQHGTIEVLNYFKRLKIKQIVISAREHNSLINDIMQFGISSYFDKVQGISNNYAKGKQELFETYFKETNISPQNVLLIGDTLHDFEIAEKFNLNFIQMAKGHQNASHFADKNIISINSLSELKFKSF